MYFHLSCFILFVEVNIMTRYICPKCGQFFYYRLERCPHCNVKFKYPDVKKEEPKVEEAPVEEVKPIEEEPIQEVPTEVVNEVPAEPANEAPKEEAPAVVVPPKSYFDGKLIQLIGYRILSSFICLITLFIALPWVTCMSYRWEVKHTVVDDKRLRFDGYGAQLFGSYIKWLLLSIVTLMIYSLWIPIKILKWKTKHTHFVSNN